MKILFVILGLISVVFCAEPGVPGLLDCVFKCQSPKNPFPNPTIPPTANGCGSQGIVADPSQLPNPQFLTCCNNHDYCYGTCNSNKETCDKTFETCMKNTCGTSLKTSIRCKLTAEAFYGIVRAAGCPSYLAAQKKYCLCR